MPTKGKCYSVGPIYFNEKPKKGKKGKTLKCWERNGAFNRK